MKLFSRTYGSGPPLLILHGLLGSGGNWHTLASRTFAPFFTVFAVDLRNHGKSPHDDEFSFGAMVRDLVDFIDEIANGQIGVIGHSLGGKVAMRLALDHPDRIDRLVSVDIAPRAYPDGHTPIFQALKKLDLASFGDRRAIDRALATDIPDAAVRGFLLQNVIRNGDSFSWRMNLRAIEEGYPKILEAVTSSRPFMGPTLFIRGGDSNYVRSGDESSIRKLFPAARIETIKNAGHWVHADQPAEFADRVLSFLTENSV